MKHLIKPVYFLASVVVLCLLYKPASITFLTPQKTENISVALGNNLWQEWCVYTFKTGLITKKYLYTVSGSSLTPVNTRANSLCP